MASEAAKGHCSAPDCAGCERHTTVCYMCSSECGLVAHVRDGQVVGVFGDEGHPMSHGGLCPRAFGAPELVHATDRIRRPLKRVGERGEGRFEEVSWEQALDAIARELVAQKRAEGAHSLLVQFGEKPDHDLVYRFANAYGTPNVLDHDSICDSSRRTGFMYTYGARHHRPLPDLNRPLTTQEGVREQHDCRYLLLVGENPLEATRFFYLHDGIRQALREGMHLTVADPFRTATAELAQDWLAVRPGTDLALALTLLRYLVEHDDPGDPARRYLDHQFIRERTTGFDELKRFLLGAGERFTPAWGEEKTGVAAATLARVAHEFGLAKPAAAMVGMNGVGHHTNGFSTTRAVAMMIALTGNLDVPGGVALAPQAELSSAEVHGTSLLPPGQAERHKDLFAGYPLAYRGVKAKDPADMLDGVRLTHGPHAGERYRIRSLLVIHGNPLINAPGSHRWHEALTRREGDGRYAVRLTVFNDTQLNDTGLYADWVLPMASFLERQGLCRTYVNEPSVSLRDPVLGPLHQARTPLGWLKPLAEACVRHGDRDLEGAIPYPDDDAWCDALLAGCPGLPWHENGVAPDGARLTVAWLRAHGGTALWPARYRKYELLDTPSGKVELRSGAIDAANARFGTGYEPLIGYEENRWSPTHPEYAALSREYPFQLVTGRSYQHTGSATQNVPSLLKRRREPKVQLNPKDAQALKVNDGDWVIVRNPLGAQIRSRAEVTEKMRPGVVRATHGWGQRSKHLTHAAGQGYNVNQLTDDANVNPVSGNAGLGDMMVAIERER